MNTQRLIVIALILNASTALAQDDVALDKALAEMAAAEEAAILETGGETIEISGEAPDDDETGAGYELEGETIRTLPGSGNDTLKALQSLPAVGRIPYGLGGLSLRGSSPRDSSVYLDGIRVPILYHFGGLASFYPSSMLESVNLIPGGYGADYGRSQGGLVTLESKAGRTDRWRVASEVSLLDAQARADGPDGRGGRWSIGVRRSYVDAILALAFPDDSDIKLTLAPRYYDAQLRYDIELGNGHKLTAMVFGSDDRLELAGIDDDDDDAGPGSFKWLQSFVRAGLRYRKSLGRTDVSATTWVGLDKSSITVVESYVDREQLPVGSRFDIFSVRSWGHLAAGFDLQATRSSYNVFNEPPSSFGVDRAPVLRDGTSWYTDAGLWTEGFVRVDGGRLGIKPGLRIDRLGITDEWVVNPRLSVTHELPGFDLEESIGLYHQPPYAADLDPVSGNPDLRSSNAIQATIGVEKRRIAGVLDTKVTGFYEDVRDMAVDSVTSASPAVETRLGGGAAAASAEALSEQFGYYSYQENRGRGRNYGVEMSAKRETDRSLAWVSYTYSRSLRRDDPRSNPFYRPFVLDQPHRVTALASTRLGDSWRLGTRVRYASGNPITPVAGSYFDGNDQSYKPIDGEVLSERLPAFFQLDLRLDRTWSRQWGTLALFVDVQNVTNRVNPEGVSYNFDYSQVDYTRGLPIFPSIGVEYRQ